jgi:hypothetical protein
VLKKLTFIRPLNPSYKYAQSPASLQYFGKILLILPRGVCAIGSFHDQTGNSVHLILIKTSPLIRLHSGRRSQSRGAPILLHIFCAIRCGIGRHRLAHKGAYPLTASGLASYPSTYLSRIQQFHRQCLLKLRDLHWYPKSLPL